MKRIRVESSHERSLSVLVVLIIKQQHSYYRLLNQNQSTRQMVRITIATATV